MSGSESEMTCSKSHSQEVAELSQSGACRGACPFVQAPLLPPPPRGSHSQILGANLGSFGSGKLTQPSP